ncbi:hypothetical protein ACFFUS_10500 [Vibrio gallaecicus]|uniref:hypothetical protein n=1 Tax=Vibrio gallaecicus TaxID=552386 RepID=UPI0010C9AE44|nr:hypothetical protein [Vibrio gallaecicus]MDN3616770.1 hypothetical protein [Vibrio gallaecicus]
MKESSSEGFTHNQLEFLNEIFYQDASEDFSGVIADEILRLYDLLPDTFKNDINEFDWWIRYAQDLANNPSPFSLLEINKTLHKRQLITTLELASFITSSIQLKSYDQDKFDLYKAISLVTLAHLSSLGDHRAKINKLTNEMRQYAQGRRKKLVSLLPDLKKHNFDSVMKKFEEDIESDETNEQQKLQLTHFRNAIRDSYMERQGIHRKVDSRTFVKDSRLLKSSAQFLDDKRRESITEIREVFAQITTKETHEVEDYGKSERSISLVTSTDFIKQDKYVNALRSRAINKSIARREMNLACNINHVNDFDISILVRHCIDAIRQETKEMKVAKAAMLMLYSGSTLDAIKHWKPFRVRKGASLAGVLHSLELPAVKNLSNDVNEIVSDIEINYVIHFPLNILDQLSNFRFEEVEREDISALLSNIKKEHQSAPSISAISRYMKQVMTDWSVDICIIELITANEIQNEPARYYTLIPKSDLYKQYERYTKHLGELSKSNFIDDFADIEKTGCLGSPFLFNNDILKILLGQFNRYFDKIKRSDIDYFSNAYHNMRILELQIIIGIASGYRAVIDQFGLFSDIHLDTGMYRIADKERDTFYSGRVVILGEIALNKIKAYKRYCEEAFIYHQPHSMHVSHAYLEAIDSQRAFCFYIEKNKIVPLSPRSSEKQMKYILPVQVNWTRHYLRSFLYSKNVSDEIIAAFLGHQYMNLLPFSQFSQLTILEIKNIADLIDKQLNRCLKGEL